MNRRGPILKEGCPFLLPPTLVALLGFVVGWPLLGWVGVFAAVAVAAFFRNPARRPPKFHGLALAPADGRIQTVARVEDPHGSGQTTWKVSIFMSVLNVHVNRSPVYGRVTEVRHIPGAFLRADHDETSWRNERNLVRIQMNDGHEMSCVQVAGVLARRIVCWIQEGKGLSMGEPFGMIRFGSRVDCYFPLAFDPDVRVGQRVWAGETTLGYFK
jgi:phosphatidylserine decarboxylase